MRTLVIPILRATLGGSQITERRIQITIMVTMIATDQRSSRPPLLTTH